MTAHRGNAAGSAGGVAAAPPPRARAAHVAPADVLPRTRQPLDADLTHRLLHSATGVSMVHVPKALRTRLADIVVTAGAGDPLRTAAIVSAATGSGRTIAAKIAAIEDGRPERVLHYGPGLQRLPKPGADQVRRRALALLRDGCCARALRALDDIAAPARQGLTREPKLGAAMKRLFPARSRRSRPMPDPAVPAALPGIPPAAAAHGGGIDYRPRSTVRDAAAGADWTAWEEAVRRAIFQPKPRTCPGVTGIRAEHLAEMVRAPVGATGAPVLGALAVAIDRILAGEATGSRLHDSRLIPLLRKDAAPLDDPRFKPRPIGVGDALVAAAKRIAATQLREAAVPLFEGAGQFLEVPDGCPRLAERVVTAHARGYWVVGLDVANAFNSVDRAAVMAAVNEACPSVSGFVRTSLEDTRMMLSADAAPIVAEQGVVQGCPMSPTLFALTLREAVARAADDLASASGEQAAELQSAAGSAARAESRPAVAAAATFAVLPQSLDPADAEPRDGAATVYHAWYADDGHLVSASLEALDVAIEALSRRLRDIGLSLNRAKFKLLCPPGEDPQVVRSDAAVRRSRWLHEADVVDAMVVLGTPIGQKESCVTHAQTVLTAAIARVHRIGLLDAPFAEIRVLRLCGTRPLLQHLVLAVPAEVSAGADLFAEADKADENAFKHALRHHAEDAEPAELRLALAWARLPSHHGGLGIRSLRDVVIEDSSRPGRYRLRTEAEQRTFDAEAADKVIATARGLSGGEYHVARLRELASGNGQAIRWLTDGNPIALIDDRRDPSIEATALAIVAGVPTLAGIPAGTECLRRCSRAGTPAHLDPHARHLYQCPSFTLVKRHDAVRDALHTSMCAWFGRERVRKEVGPSVDGSGGLIERWRQAGRDAGSTMYPGDVWVNTGTPGVREYFLDVVVKDTWGDGLVKRAAERGDAAADAGYGEKLRATAGSARDALLRNLKSQSKVLVPIALGAFGGISLHTTKWLRTASRAAELGAGNMPVHALRRGEPARWRQAAMDLSAAVVIAQAEVIAVVRQQMSGRADASLRRSVGPIPAATEEADYDDDYTVPLVTDALPLGNPPADPDRGAARADPTGEARRDDRTHEVQRRGNARAGRTTADRSYRARNTAPSPAAVADDLASAHTSDRQDGTSGTRTSYYEQRRDSLHSRRTVGHGQYALNHEMDDQSEASVHGSGERVFLHGVGAEDSIDPLPTPFSIQEGAESPQGPHLIDVVRTTFRGESTRTEITGRSDRRRRPLDT